MKHSAPSPRTRGLIAIAAIGLAMMGCSADIKITGHALLIGLSDYPGTDNDLPNVANDITDMDDLLVGQGWTVTRLENSAATESAIISGIKNFLAPLQKGETALIYYSGHGFEMNGGAYLVPYDYFSADNALISADELADAMSASAGKNVVVVIDACYSGGFIGPSDAADAAPQDYSLGKGATTELFPFSALSRFGELLVRNSAASGTAAPIVIAAAGSLETSWEGGAVDNGLFTYFFMESAEAGDLNGDGWVSCTEAYAYASKGIQLYWNNGISNSTEDVPPEDDEDYLPRISGGMRDFVLFKAP